MSSKEYLFNDSGVCKNPDVTFFFMPKDALAWAYISIEIAEQKGLFMYGAHSIGGGTPCSRPKYKTRKEAIQAGIKFLDRTLSTDYSGLGVKTEVYRKSLEEWKASQNQLTLF